MALLSQRMKHPLKKAEVLELIRGL